MLLCIVYAMLFVNTVNTKIKAHNALNGMFVNTVEDTGICGSYTSTVYRVMRCENSTLLCIQWPLTPTRRAGYLLFKKPSILGV